MRRVLAIIIHEIDPHLGGPEIATIVESIEPLILAGNMKFYRNLRNYLKALKTPAAFENIISAAMDMMEVQLAKLRKYPFFSG